MQKYHAALVNTAEIRLSHASASWVLFNHTGKHLYSGGHSPQIWMWDVQQSVLLSRIDTGLDGLHGADLHPQLHRLAGGGADGSVRVWDLDSGVQLVSAQPHRRVVSDVRFADAGAVLVSASGDGTVRFSDATTGKRVTRLKRLGSGIHGLAVAHDRPRIGVVYFFGTRVWDLSQDDLFHRDGIYYHGGEGQSDLVFSPDGRYLWVAFRSHPALRVWDLDSQPATLVHEIDLRGLAFNLALSHDATYLAIGLWDEIALLHTRSYELVQRWKAPNGTEQHQGAIAKLVFSPDDQLLCSTDVAGGIWIWSMAALVG